MSTNDYSLGDLRAFAHYMRVLAFYDMLNELNSGIKGGTRARELGDKINHELGIGANDVPQDLVRFVLGREAVGVEEIRKAVHDVLNPKTMTPFFDRKVFPSFEQQSTYFPKE